MKRNTTLLKLLLVFVSFVMTSNSYSQIDSTYVPFPTDSTAWNETFTSLLSVGDESVSYFYFILGDSITIDSIDYIALYKGKKAFDVDYEGTELVLGIREENKKIYFKYEGTSPEIFSYDFSDSISIGDTVMHFPNDPYYGFGTISLKDSILLNDSTLRKRYILYERDPGLPQNSTVIEGIGSIDGLVSLGRDGDYMGTTLNCVFTPNKIIYINQNTSDHNCYELGVSINELEENNQLIYPNPFENVLNFAEKLDKSKVVVYSISGQKVFENNNFSGNTLDLHFLEKGIYYLKVKAEKSYYQKIVKL